MKKLIVTLLAAGGALSIFASPVSPEQALGRISSSGPMKSVGISPSNLKLAHTVSQKDGTPAAYFFTPLSGHGFAILSADDAAVPVLGYSSSSDIDVTNLPPALLWWLEKQAEHINYQSQNGLPNGLAKVNAPADMTEIAPIVKTKWDQGSPYDQQTPIVQGRQSPTGCVATSFAQAMKYFNYPQRGKGNVTYYDNGTRRVMNFTKDFNWDQMLDSYVSGNYTEAQAEAVSFLMKACGYTVEMSYGAYSSGAASYKLAQAAVNYFNYDVGVRYVEREYYSLDQWMRMVYDNIKNIGPVIYDGQSAEGGHSFICDGYDGNGYFHFNWGWGGMSDGYYVLDALNPESQGIGGSEGGFNYSQGILLGLQPPKEGSHYPYAQMNIYGNATASLSQNNILFGAVSSKSAVGWGNASYRQATFGVGAIISKADGTGTDIVVDGYMQFDNGSQNSSISLGELSYYATTTANPSIPLPQLADGNYIVTVGAKDLGQTGAPMLPMLVDYGGVNYCYLTVSGGKYTVTSGTPSSLTFTDCELTSPLYLNRNTRFATTISNTSDLQLSLCYYPALYRDGAIQYMGDFMLVTVDPGEKVENSNFTRFAAAKGATSTGLGTYQLVMVDKMTNRIMGYYGEYNMESVSGNISIQVDNFGIADAPQQTVTSGSKTFSDTYVINDASDLDIIFDYTVIQGYFDKKLRIAGAQYNYQTNSFVNFSEDVYSDYPFVGQGAEEKLTIPMDLSELQEGYVYRLAAGWVDGNTTKSLGIIYFLFNSSGIEGIENDTAHERPVYYNLQGVKVDNPVKGQILIRKISNKIDKIVY